MFSLLILLSGGKAPFSLMPTPEAVLLISTHVTASKQMFQFQETTKLCHPGEEKAEELSS